ncbi:MAG: ComF family protein [Clostridia bacterium]|jgi:ComF family protein|nr:ComF family protein [Clostridia bacterium]
MSFKEILKKIKDILLNALYPNDLKCIFCGRDIPKPYICQQCLDENIFNDGNRCQKCDTPIKDDNIVCDHCKKLKRHFEKCCCPFIYEGKVRQAILKFKSDGAKYLAKPFANFIFERLKLDEIEFDIIVPVPSHKSSLRKRGYNPAKVLADELSILSNKPVADVFYKATKTANQKYLNYEERQTNLENTILLLDNSVIKNKKVLIVDDIITTGATIEACAKLLHKSESIYAAAVARRAEWKQK